MTQPFSALMYTCESEFNACNAVSVATDASLAHTTNTVTNTNKTTVTTAAAILKFLFMNN